MKAIIHIDETLNIKADAKGIVSSTESNGKVSIKNPSKQTTMWGIDLKAELESDVLDFQDETVEYIQAENEYVKAYNTDVKPQIVIDEKVDTNYDGDKINPNNKDLVFDTDQSLAFQITLTNNYNFDLKNLKVEKYFPNDISEIRAIDPYSGEVTILPEDSLAVWKLNELKAGKAATLIISVKSHPTEVQPYNTGKIIFTCEASNKLSSLSPEIHGEADNIDLGIEVSESNVPNQWNINFGLRNNSEFEIYLENVKIEVDGEDRYNEKPETELDANIDETVWNKTIVVESNQYPEVTKSFRYFVMYDIPEYSRINYKKDNDLIYVTKVGVTKAYEPPNVRTHAVADLVGTIDITNTGTSNIGRIEIDDTIPPYVEIEKIFSESPEQNIEIHCKQLYQEDDKKQVEEEREKATFERLEEGEDEEEVTTEEIVECEDVTKSRLYNYVIENINIEPGQLLKIKTAGIANKPKKDGEHPGPAKIRAYAPNPTIPYETKAKMDGKEPFLFVEFKQRSFSVTSVFKKISPGETEISIPVKNTGDVPLDNVLVTQPIFNAEYSSHIPPTVDVKVENSQAKCHIKRINVGEKVEIVLTVRSDGPLRQQQATIKIED